MTFKKFAKTATNLYLFADGHAVVKHSESHPKAGYTEWAEVHEQICPSVWFAASVKGRVIFDNVQNIAGLLLKATHIYVSSYKIPERLRRAQTEYYSDEDHYFVVEITGKDFCVSLCHYPGIMSNGISVQPAEHMSEAWEEVEAKCYWGTLPIGAKHNKEAANVR